MPHLGLHQLQARNSLKTKKRGTCEATHFLQLGCVHFPPPAPPNRFMLRLQFADF